MQQAQSFVHLHHQTVDSTHLWCKRERIKIEKFLITAPFVIVSCNEQTQGQGRRGRVWFAKAGQIAFNLNLLDPIDARAESHNQIVHFALAASHLIQQKLIEHKVPAKLKWPNDLVTEKGKLGGLIIERVSGESGYYLSLGIGLNVELPEQAELEILQSSGALPVDCLKNYGFLPNIIPFIEELSFALVERFRKLKELPLDYALLFADSITAVGRHVRLTYQPSLTNEAKSPVKGQLSGRILAIDNEGCLHLLSHEGTIVRIRSGECEQVRSDEEAPLQKKSS